MNAPISANSPPNCPDKSQSHALKVGGITPFTATDYPGKLAAVVFVQGCPWRCGYCHNPHLQPRTSEHPLHWSWVTELLKRRAGLIDAVVFSGGEPTIDAALQDAMTETRALGFQIGLHSGGAYPKRLASVLPLVDWIGLDIKAPFDRYEKITAIGESGRKTLESAEAILASGIDYEFRTTLHPALLPEDDIIELAQALAKMGVKNYALQVFRAQGCNNEALNAAAVAGYPGADLIERVSGLFPRFTLRQT